MPFGDVVLVCPQRHLRVDRRRPADTAAGEERDGVAVREEAEADRPPELVGRLRLPAVEVDRGQVRAGLEQQDVAAALGELPGDHAAARARPDHDHVEPVIHAMPRQDQSLRRRRAAGGSKPISAQAPSRVAARLDEVGVERLDRQRADEGELWRALLLGQRLGAAGGRREGVDRLERAVAHRRRHPVEERVDVDHRPDPRRPGHDQLAERLQGSGPLLRREPSSVEILSRKPPLPARVQRLDLRSGQSRHVALHLEAEAGLEVREMPVPDRERLQ